MEEWQAMDYDENIIDYWWVVEKDSGFELLIFELKYSRDKLVNVF